MGEPGEPGQKGRQVSALPTPAHPEAPVPAAGVASTTLCSCTGRSRHRRPHWIPWTQGKLLLTLPGGWGHGDKPRASCLQEGPAMGSGCAQHSPSPLPLTHWLQIQVSTAPSWGSVSLLLQLTELRGIFGPLDYQFIIKGCNGNILIEEMQMAR